ncbi:methionine aminopeptidase [Toxoplasma gondii CAST]|uniref:Methionine aminopeptidase n=1 Tax=Toxoplasma gondii CAST TaxID=943122 RepID=A0A3R8AYA9_TOXGO|nr:methionine aminopeptidase [Toxoplasma gondii CAST]
METEGLDEGEMEDGMLLERNDKDPSRVFRRTLPQEKAAIRKLSLVGNTVSVTPGQCRPNSSGSVTGAKPLGDKRNNLRLGGPRREAEKGKTWRRKHAVLAFLILLFMFQTPYYLASHGLPLDADKRRWASMSALANAPAHSSSLHARFSSERLSPLASVCASLDRRRSRADFHRQSLSKTGKAPKNKAEPAWCLLSPWTSLASYGNPIRQSHKMRGKKRDSGLEFSSWSSAFSRGSVDSFSPSRSSGTTSRSSCRCRRGSILLLRPVSAAFSPGFAFQFLPLTACDGVSPASQARLPSSVLRASSPAAPSHSSGPSSFFASSWRRPSLFPRSFSALCSSPDVSSDNASSSTELSFPVLRRIVPGRVSPSLSVGAGIVKPHYAEEDDGRAKAKREAMLSAELQLRRCEGDEMKARLARFHPVAEREMEWIKPQAEVEGVRRACEVTREVLQVAVDFVKGVCAQSSAPLTTEDIDRVVHEETMKRGAYPSPLRYCNFPKSVCTSTNEIVCHGIPDDRPLQRGSICSIDVSCFLDGFHGDCARTVPIGGFESLSPPLRRLLVSAREATLEGIRVCAPGRRLSVIGDAIEEFLTRRGYSTIHDFCGHGIGRNFHEEPFVLHASNNMPGRMLPGMCFTIEPVVCMGGTDYTTWPDKWTIATTDGKPTAQFEHTVLITDTGVEVLTDCPDGETDMLELAKEVF